MSGGDPLRPPVPIRRPAPPPIPHGGDFGDLRPSDHFVMGKRHAVVSWQLIFHLAWALFSGVAAFLYMDMKHSNELLSQSIADERSARLQLGTKVIALETTQREAIAAGKMIDIPGMQKQMHAIEMQLTRLNAQFEDFTRDAERRGRGD